MKKTLRTLKGTVDTANVRLASLKGEEHVVFPVVAMIGDIVIYHMTSDSTKNGEFIPAEALEDLPNKWNDTMVVPDHPMDVSGTPIAASTPDVATSMSYGRVYNAEYSNGALRWEIWLSSARADIVGLGAPEAIAKAQRGEIVENSISFYSYIEEVEGTSPNGTPYSFKHHDIVPEHFAFGLNGAKGACGIDDGCGGPRVASAKVESLKPRSRVLRAAASKDENPALRLLRRAYHAAADLGVSDSDLRRSISAQLSATVPGFDWIRSVFQETNIVVYDVFLLDHFSLWQQGFSRSDDGTITLSDDAQQVMEQTTTEFVPIPVSTSDGTNNNSEESEPDLELERTTMNEEERKALVQKVIANTANCFTAEHEQSLLKTEDNILTAMAGTPEPATGPASTPVAEPATSPTAASGDCGCEDTPKGTGEPPQAFSAPLGTVLLSDEDHTEIMAAIKESKDLKAAQKASLTAALILANPALTEDELSPLSLEALTKMVPPQQHSGPVNYSLMGGPVPVVAETRKIPAVMSLAEQMKPKDAAPIVN